jgi:hypothetical protein
MRLLRPCSGFDRVLRPLADIVTVERDTPMNEAVAPPTSRQVHWAGFLAMCGGMFMAILDIQIVASSLPNIQSALAIPWIA